MSTIQTANLGKYPKPTLETSFWGRTTQALALVTASFIGQADRVQAAETSSSSPTHTARRLSSAVEEPKLSELTAEQQTLLNDLKDKIERSRRRGEIISDRIDTILNDEETEKFLDSPKKRTSKKFCILRTDNYCEMPDGVLDLDQIADAAKLSKSEWLCRIVISPTDRMRPGILIVSDRMHAEDVNKEITVLRNATTASLIARKAFRRHISVRKTRATSIIIAKPKSTLECGLTTSTLKQMRMPRTLAAYEITHGRAAICKALPLEGDIADSSDSASPAYRAASYLRQLMAERIREFAFRGAYELQCKAIEVKKPTRLLGLEIDLHDRYPIGIHYIVKTKEGQIYKLFHIGENFSDKKPRDPLPPKKYAGFNVTLLLHYQDKGEITKSDLYEIALDYNLYPIEEGRIIYVDPARVGEEHLKKATEILKAKFAQQKFLLLKDVENTLGIPLENLISIGS